MKKLAIFDLDGTLVSSIDDITRCVNEAFEYFNIPSITKDQCMKSLGHGARSLVISSLEYSGYTPSSDAEREDIINKYNEIYGLCDQAATKPFDGIMQMLKNIREAGYRTAIVSNKPHPLTLKMSQNLFGELIETTYGQSDMFPKKPDPTIINHLLSEFGIDASESVYIGDTDVDVMTAKNSGMTAVAVSWGYRSRDIIEAAGPDYIADTVEELEKIFHII